MSLFWNCYLYNLCKLQGVLILQMRLQIWSFTTFSHRSSLAKEANCSVTITLNLSIFIYCWAKVLPNWQIHPQFWCKLHSTSYKFSTLLLLTTRCTHDTVRLGHFMSNVTQTWYSIYFPYALVKKCWLSLPFCLLMRPEFLSDCNISRTEVHKDTWGVEDVTPVAKRYMRKIIQ